MRGVMTRCQISLQLIVSFEMCAPHQNSSMFKYGVVEQFFGGVPIHFTLSSSAPRFPFHSA